jgi:hypothetical protein
MTKRQGLLIPPREIHLAGLACFHTPIVVRGIVLDSGLGFA